MDVWDFRYMSDPAALQGWALLSHVFSMAAPEANLKYQQAKLYWITHANIVCAKHDKTVGSQIRQLHTNHTGSAKNVTCVYIKLYKKYSDSLSARHFLLHELRDDSYCSRNKTLGCCGPCNPTCGILAHLAASASNVPYFFPGKFSEATFFYFWCCTMSFLSFDAVVSLLCPHTVSLWVTFDREQLEKGTSKENEPGYPWSSCPLICIHLDLDAAECSKTCQGWI